MNLNWLLPVLGDGLLVIMAVSMIGNAAIVFCRSRGWNEAADFFARWTPVAVAVASSKTREQAIRTLIKEAFALVSPEADRVQAAAMKVVAASAPKPASAAKDPPTTPTPPTLPPALPCFLMLVLILTGCGLPAMVRVADGAAVAGEAARPVLRETCPDPMVALAKRVLAAKNAQDIALWSAASQEAELLASRCDPAIDAQRLLLSLHAALRAGIVAWHAGEKPKDIDALATKIGVAATKLAQSLAALASKPDGAS